MSVQDVNVAMRHGVSPWGQPEARFSSKVIACMWPGKVAVGSELSRVIAEEEAAEAARKQTEAIRAELGITDQIHPFTDPAVLEAARAEYAQATQAEAEFAPANA